MVETVGLTNTRSYREMQSTRICYVFFTGLGKANQVQKRWSRVLDTSFLLTVREKGIEQWYRVI